MQEVLRATNPRGFMQGVMLGLADGYSPEEVADKLIFPVLMISGRDDRVNPIDKNAALLLKALRQGRLEVLEGIGHLPEVEAPDGERPIEGFLRGLADGPAALRSAWREWSELAGGHGDQPIVAGLALGGSLQDALGQVRLDRRRRLLQRNLRHHFVERRAHDLDQLDCSSA